MSSAIYQRLVAEVDNAYTAYMQKAREKDPILVANYEDEEDRILIYLDLGEDPGDNRFAEDLYTLMEGTPEDARRVKARKEAIDYISDPSNRI